ncbi:hypothetical protein HML84_21260 [Alcanivorax sp. IO_7]|nr:hypothetical protein HML84_21260 [Alcanivorax sp. IO_7]
MAHTSLRTRVMTMTALPAFLAALIIGGYTLATQVMDVRADNAHRQQLIVESYAARLGRWTRTAAMPTRTCCATCWSSRTCAPPPCSTTAPAGSYTPAAAAAGGTGGAAGQRPEPAGHRFRLAAGAAAARR